MTNVTSITTAQHLFHIFIDNPWNRKRVLTNATSDFSFLYQETKKTDFTEKAYIFDMYLNLWLYIYILYTYVDSYTSLFNHLPLFNVSYRLIYYFIFYYDCPHYFSHQTSLLTHNRHTVERIFEKSLCYNLKRNRSFLSFAYYSNDHSSVLSRNAKFEGNPCQNESLSYRLND